MNDRQKLREVRGLLDEEIGISHGYNEFSTILLNRVKAAISAIDDHVGEWGKESIKLSRTGRAPLQFEGRMLASGSVSVDKRRFDVSIFESISGKHVMYIYYSSEWKSEHACKKAILFDDLQAAVERLEQIDPLVYVRGFPDDPKYAKKQAALDENVTNSWGRLVSQVIDGSGYAEEL